MQGWQDIQAEALRRIQKREWLPGDLIPNEADLALEMGAARATVNRALRALADDGWLERRRRAGTRVALSPQRRAKMSVAVLRRQIEDGGAAYSHRLIHRSVAGPILITQTLHMADAAPFAVEDREINLTSVPLAADADLTAISANEWLVQNTPFDHGTMRYEAVPATTFESTYLACATGTAVMVLHRETRSEADWITKVRLVFAPGHSISLNI